MNRRFSAVATSFLLVVSWLAGWPAAAQMVTKTVSVGSSPRAVGVNPVTNKIYVANYAAGTVTVIDGATNTPTAVPVGNGPTAVAVNPVTNQIYVANFTDGTVTAIDGATNATATITVGTSPQAMAVNPVTNKIYVANSGSNNVTVINGATNTPATVTAGTNPYALAINPVTNKIYVANNQGAGTVTVIDGATNTPATVSVGSHPDAVAVNPVTNSIYVANSVDGTVTVINGATNGVATVTVGANPTALAVNPVTNSIYVANCSGGTVTVINGATNATATVAAGTFPYAVAVNSVTNQIYVANNGGGTVSVMDGATTATVTVNVGVNPYALTVNPVTNKIYVANNSGGTVSVMDGATYTATATVTVGNDPGPAEVNPVTNKMYVANWADGTVTVIDGATNTTATLTFGVTPADVAINPVTNKIYVTDDNSNNVTVIDGATNALTTVGIGTGSEALAVNPVTNRIYVAAGSTVKVIDGITSTVVATVTVGTSPWAVALNPVTNKIYVANNQSAGTVTVIDGATNATTTVGVGNAPKALDVNPVTNKIYVANYNDGTVTVINGATNLQAALVNVGSEPDSVAVNPITNKIYVVNWGADTVTVIDGATNTATAAVSVGWLPNQVIVNTSTNKIYAVGPHEGTVTMIDGATNTSKTLDVPNASNVGVNPVTNKLYVTDDRDNIVTVLAEQPVWPIPLQAGIVALAGNVTGILTPSFSFSASSAFAPFAPPPDNLLYQLDTWQGAWTAATSQGNGAFSGQFAPALQPGFHILYAYSTDGQEATSVLGSAGEGGGTNPLISNITAYGFLVAPPAATLSTSSLNFGSQTVGVSSASQTLTLSNSGGPLAISGISISGTNSGDFSEFDNCNGALATGGSCTLEVAFTPSTSGAESATLTVTDDSGAVAGTTQTADLAGTGSGTTLSLSASSLSFASQLAGTQSSDKTVTVTNTGTANLVFTGINVSSDFVIDTTTPGATTCSTSTPVAHAGTCKIAVAFAPSQAGALSGALTLNDNSYTSPQTVALTGTGTAPTLGLSSYSLGFGSQVVGATSAAEQVEITNTGTSVLTFSSLAASGDFSVDASTTTCSTSTPLGTNSSCAIGVTFTPAAAGARTGSLSIASSAGTSDVTLTGTGTAPGVSLSPSSLTFGSTVVGVTATAQSVTLTNTGTSALTLTAITPSGDFALDSSTTCSTSSPLGSNGACTIAVTFSPTAISTRTGNIIITDNASGGTQTIALTGTGTAPGASLSPSSLTFGSTVVGVTATAQSVTLTNTGTSPLTLTAITPSGDFALDPSTTCSTSSPLASNGACTIAVTFSPTAISTRTGNIIITDNASGGTQTIALSGTGTAPGASLSPSSLTFGSTVVGVTATAQSVTLTNTGTSPLTLTAITPSGDFALDSSTTCSTSSPLGSNGACTIAVTFSPTAISTRTGNIIITDNASGGTQTIALTGTGTAPGASLSPSSLTFGSTVVGVTATAQSVTLTNTGTSPLTLTAISPSGDFALDPSTTCSTSSPLASNGACTIAVTFSPTATNTRTGNIIITDNASGGTQTIALSGTGTAPGASLSPSSLTFGSTVVGVTATAQSVTLTNTGTSALTLTAITPSGDFALDSSTTCSTSSPLGSNGACTIAVTFSPTTISTRTGNIIITDNASGGTQTIALTGTGIAPALGLSSSSLTFGSTVVGVTSVASSVTVTNTGTSALAFSTFAASGDFTVDATTTTCSTSTPLGTNSSCAIGVTFTPAAAGARTGSLSIASSAGTSDVTLTGTGTAPGVSLDPSSLTFGSTVVGVTATAQSVTLTNTGTSPLTLTAITPNGDFALDASTTCSTSSPVAANGGSCTIAVSFSPAAIGTRTGTIIITDNASGGTQTIALTGTGTAPGASLSPSSLTFGSTVVGVTATAQSVTLTNTGTSPLTLTAITPSGDFALDSSTTCSTSSPLASNGACTIAVTFSPTAISTRTGNIIITDNASGGTQTIALTGTGTAPGASLSPSSLTFGSTVVGVTATAQSVTLTNTGTSPLTLTAITPSGDFALDSSTTCSTSSPLGSNGACTIAVTFSPTTISTRTGNIIITDNASGGTQTIALTGTGTAPGVSLSPSSLAFGSQNLDTTSVSQPITLSNTGNATLTIQGIAATSNFVEQDNCGSSLAGNSSCTINVTFAPTAGGALTGTLTVTDNSNEVAGSTQTVTLTGAGTGPLVSLSAASLTFAAQMSGSSSAAQTVSLTNMGAGALSISSITASGDFAETSTCAATVNAEENCIISVTFKPAEGGSRTGTLTITDNAAGSPHSVALSGMGQDFSFAPASGSSTSATVAPGSPATYTISIGAGEGGLTGTVSFTCSGAPSGATCTVSPSPITLGSSPTTVIVTVTTAAASLSAPRPQPLAPLPPSPPGARGLWTLALALLAMAWAIRRRKQTGVSRWPSALLPLAAGLLLMLALVGCGGGGGINTATNPGTPAGTSTLTVTGTTGSGSSARSHSVTLTLIVS